MKVPFMLFSRRNASQERIVITGLGCISPLGNTVEKTWKELLAGSSSIRFNPNLACGIAAQVKDEQEMKSQIQGTRATKFALQAAIEAMEDSKLMNSLDVSRSRIGVCVGTSVLSVLGEVEEAFEKANSKREAKENEKVNLNRKNNAFKSISPRFIPRILGNTPASAIASAFKLQGPQSAPSVACATGAHALAEAYFMLKERKADAFLAGACEAPLNALAIGGFMQMRALAVPRTAEEQEKDAFFNSNPSSAALCKPFSPDRRGFVLGEGAAIFVLERLESALARKAQIYCELKGIGLSTAPGEPTNLCEDSVYEAMKMAIEEAERAQGKSWKDAESESKMKEAQFNSDVQLSTHFNGDLQLSTHSNHSAHSNVHCNSLPNFLIAINAHATGTRQGDAAELKAISRLSSHLHHNQSFLPICATKAATGHLLAAAGALEAIFSVLSLKDHILPATLNYHQDANGIERDLEKLPNSCELRILPQSQHLPHLKGVLCNSFGFGGANVSLMFTAYEGEDGDKEAD